MNWIFTIIFVFAASIAFGQQTQDIYASICQGDTYTQNGFNESTTGVFTRTEDLGGGVTNTIILHLTVNPLPNVFISGSDNLCSGSASLTATNVTGGSGETYLWSNGATTSTNTVITAGTYSVTITDANGCTASASKAVSEEANITFTVTTNNVSCYSRTDGSVSITNTSGGTAPYSYSWSNGSAGNIIANLSAGDYSVTISDASQCTAVSAIQITQPSEISVLSATTDASCTGVCDGKISCVANGGVPPLSLAWSNGGSLNELTSLCEGSYTLTVTDQHNCQITKTFDVGHRANMEAKATSKNVSCYGVSDGTITVSVTNGNPPYFYSIIENVNEDENNIIANLAAGEYTVYVKDSKGCTASTNAAITSPERLSVQYETTEISCKEASDGSIHLIISGGTAPYFVTTNNISEHELNDSAMVNGLRPGTYHVVVSDSNRCSYSLKNVFVHDSPTACLRIPNVFSPNDDGINDTWEIDNIWLYEDAKILVYNRWGQNLYKGDSTSEPWDGTYKGKKLPAGPYVYVVSLGNDKKTYKGSVNIIY